MKGKVRLFLVLGLVLSLVVSPFAPTVSAATANADSNVNDLYLNQESETVLIDGISYTYDYSYEDDFRTIIITNNADNSVEKVSYEEGTSTVYYNDEGFDIIEVETNNAPISGLADWKNVSTSTKYISWAKGIGTAALAAVIAVPLTGLGAAGVIAAMGLTAIGVLAAGASGGTIKLTLQRFQVLFVAPQHRYVWSFKASTGTNYGNYIYHVN